MVDFFVKICYNLSIPNGKIKREVNATMKALFVTTPEAAKKANLTNTYQIGGRIYVAIEDSPRIPGYPIQDVQRKLNQTPSLA